MSSVQAVLLLISFLLLSHSLPSYAAQPQHEQAFNRAVIAGVQQLQEGRELTSFLQQPRTRQRIYKRKVAGKGGSHGLGAGGLATRARGKTSAANPTHQMSYLLPLASVLAYFFVF